MPPPIPVELVPHSSAWSQTAFEESQRLTLACTPCIVRVHHIGSTSIPGIRAKPIIDLLPIVRSVTELDALQDQLQSLGYKYWGEYGLPGRRYCTLDDPATGKRLFQLHSFEADNIEVPRHLAFRDYLRAQPSIAAAYDAEKQRCRQLHPLDSHAYSAAKTDWIQAHLPAALDYFRSSC